MTNDENPEWTRIISRTNYVSVKSEVVVEVKLAVRTTSLQGTFCRRGDWGVRGGCIAPSPAQKKPQSLTEQGFGCGRSICKMDILYCYIINDVTLTAARGRYPFFSHNLFSRGVCSHRKLYSICRTQRGVAVSAPFWVVYSHLMCVKVVELHGSQHCCGHHPTPSHSCPAGAGEEIEHVRKEMRWKMQSSNWQPMTKVRVSASSADLVSVWKQLNHVYDGAPLGGVGFEQCQSFITSGRRNELQDDKDMTEGGDVWITQAGLENVAHGDALVTVDHGVDHVLSSVLQGLVEERRVVLVEDERCSPS